MLKSPEKSGFRILSLTAEHALRALLYLACREGESVSANEIARAIGAPANYLSKTLQVLARHGMVAGTRGPTGGFRLMQNPRTITAASIAALFGESARGSMCLLGGVPCSHENACAAHHKWQVLHEEMYRLLEDVTLASLTGSEKNFQTLTTINGGWS